jgi:hypothetical protein
MSTYYPPGVTDADINRHFGGAEDTWDQGNLECYHDDAFRKAELAEDEGRMAELENHTIFDGDEVNDLNVWYDRTCATVQFTCRLCGEKHEQEFDLEGES